MTVPNSQDVIRVAMGMVATTVGVGARPSRLLRQRLLRHPDRRGHATRYQRSSVTSSFCGRSTAPGVPMHYPPRQAAKRSSTGFTCSLPKTAHALNLAVQMGQTRLLMPTQRSVPVPKRLLVMLIFWLIALFISFALFCSCKLHRRSQLTGSRRRNLWRGLPYDRNVLSLRRTDPDLARSLISALSQMGR
jgi:hypothetical protein